jgi:hypothetical protein
MNAICPQIKKRKSKHLSTSHCLEGIEGKGGNYGQTSKTKNPKLIYWAPLAAAAVAALIAYWGNPEKDNAKKAKASYASAPKSENNISAEIVDESSQVVASAKTKTSGILSADSNSGTLPVHAKLPCRNQLQPVPIKPLRYEQKMKSKHWSNKRSSSYLTEKN